MSTWMSLQEEIFLESEGDAWFRRNADALAHKVEHDLPLRLVSELRDPVETAVELGCSNGWRLAELSRTQGVRCIGVDASAEAVDDGRRRFPEIDLRHGSIADPPVDEPVDLVIVNFVLSWVDRDALLRAVAAADRLVRDGGYLVIGDFLPDHPCRRRYAHLTDAEMHTYKQDYTAIFTASNLYGEIARYTFDHDRSTPGLGGAASGARGMCALLQKNLTSRYPIDPD